MVASHRRGYATRGATTNVEQYRYEAYLEANLDVWDAMGLLRAEGQIRAEAWNSWNAYFEDWAAQYISARNWERLEWQYPPEHSYVATAVEAAIQ